MFFLVWSFCMPKKSLATHTFERGFFLHGKNMAPIKKAKQKTNKTANKKYFVVYIQRRMMESNDRLLQEKGTQITLRHTHTFIFLRMHAEVPAFIYPFRSRFRSFAHFMPTQPNKKTTSEIWNQINDPYIYIMRCRFTHLFLLLLFILLAVFGCFITSIIATFFSSFEIKSEM